MRRLPGLRLATLGLLHLLMSTPGPVYCSHCGAPNQAGSTYCVNCGKMLNP